MFHTASVDTNGKLTYPGDYALSSTLMVGEALRIAKIPRTLMVFGAETLKINPINTAPIRWDKLSDPDNFSKARDGATDIGNAIEKATQTLKKENTERKIMIILTDGSSEPNKIKKAYKQAKENNIEVLAILIGEEAADEDNNFLSQILPEEKKILIKDTTKNELIGEAFIKILKTTITKTKKYE